MIGMQYKITLPSDYDMDIIRKRVKENGSKTDGFQDLLFKCYLIQEKGMDDLENAYAPLYLWKESTGMNKFIFEGYYDQIIKSFGWNHINIGIPLMLDRKDNFKEAKYVVEIKGQIKPRISLMDFASSMKTSNYDEPNIVGYTCIYNPDLWAYSQFIFYTSRPSMAGDNLYQILHISDGRIG